MREEDADLDIARDLTASLRHALMKAKLDRDTVFDEKRVVVASDGRPVDHVDEDERKAVPKFRTPNHG